jgi:hypothetical protein
MFFIVCLVIFVLAIVALFVFLGLWTYRDARLRSEHSALWTVCVLVVPDLLGLVMYLLVGRTRPRPMPFPRNPFFKPLIAALVVFVLACGGGIGAIVGQLDLPTLPGVSIGQVENNVGDHWQVSFATSGEQYTRTVNLSASGLAGFTAQGSCAEGSLYLYIIQGGQSTKVDLTSRTQAPVDLSASYEPGNVQLIIANDGARDASFDLEW